MDNPTPRPHECEKCGQLHYRCLADNKRGGPCGRQPKNGQDVCRSHGAMSPQAIAAAETRIARGEIVRLHDRLGIPRPIDAGEAILELVAESAGNVAFYRTLVEALPTHPEDDEYHPAEGEVDGWWERGKPGIYGRTYHVSGIPTGEAKRVILVQMYDDERDRLARFSKIAWDARIDERRMRLAETEARQLFSDLAASINDAGLTLEQAEKLRRGLASRLRARESAELIS